jgi:acetyl esterase/lipase
MCDGCAAQPRCAFRVSADPHERPAEALAGYRNWPHDHKPEPGGRQISRKFAKKPELPGGTPLAGGSLDFQDGTPAMINILRLLGGLLFVGLGALTLFPAPNHLLWKAAVAATEWGYWVAIAALLPMIPTRGQTVVGKLGGLLSLGAIALFVMPVVRASEVSKELPTAFDKRFGSERRARAHFAEDPRTAPLVLPELLRPVALPAVRYEERTFTTRDDVKLMLDVYRPAYEYSRLPGVLVVHGGNWQGSSTNEFVALNAYLAARDLVVVAINYRVPPRHPFPAGRDDVLAALAYIKVYGPELGIDTSRLALLGRSGGGQLALLAAYTAGDPAVKGVISIYGPTDLQFGYEHPAPSGLFDTRGVLNAYLGGSPANAADAYFAASPINFVNGSSPPTLLIHGMRDPLVSPDQSARLEERLQEAGVKNMFVRLPWATHGCDKSFGGPCGQIATYAVERFLDAVLIGPAPKEPPARRAKSPAPKRAKNSSDIPPKADVRTEIDAINSRLLKLDRR